MEKDKRTLISIITVCLNSEKTIEQTILSVLAQSYDNVEYIIVDGASTDETMNIVEKYRDRISIVVSEPDEGLYYAMNKGIELSSGEIIGIINSDDWYEEGALEQVVSIFESEDLDILYGDINYVEQDKDVFIYEQPVFRSLWHLMSVNHPATFVKREVYEKYGVYDTSYRIPADVEIMNRFWRKKVRFGHIEKVLANFRAGGLSCVNKEQNEYEVRRIIDKYIEPDKFTECCLSGFTNRENPLYIWGAGRWGTVVIRCLSECNIVVDGIYDIDESKWGNTVSGIRIISPQNGGRRKQCILIAIDRDDIDISRFINEESLDNCEVIYLKECFERYERYLVEQYGDCKEVCDIK